MDKLLAAVRGSTYEGLALAFSPPVEDFYRSLEDKLLCPLKDLGSTFAWVSLKKADVLAGLIGNGLREGLQQLTSLKVEYHRLFVGPYKLPAPPYGSLYLESEPTIMGPSTLEVLRMYEEAGFVLAPSFKDLPDHIAAELEFMALLCEQEAEAWQKDDFPRAEKLLGREETFLAHLVQWIAKFSSRVHSSTESAFYRALASLVRDYIFLDRDRVHALRLLIASGDRPSAKGEARDGA